MVKSIKKIKVIVALTLLGLNLLSPISSFGSDYTVLKAQKITFQYYVGVIPFKGFFMLQDSSFAINFSRPEKSKLNLKFDLKASSAGFMLATEAMLGRSVLYAQKYPFISFESTQVTVVDNVYNIIGNVTIRGITKEIELKAQLINPEALKKNKKDLLKFNITAKFNRRHFNANGYEYLVADIIDLNSNVDLVTGDQ